MSRSAGKILLGLIVLGACGTAGYFLYCRYFHRQAYALRPDQFDLPTAPPWIRTDLRKVVYRELSRERRPSLLDPDLAERVAAAFRRQPWIAEVRRVRPLPTGRVEVDATYRRPVLMVEVRNGLLPVDAHGILLPSGGFTSPEAAKYPLLTGVDRLPPPLAGQRWMDGRVLGGAEIAAALLPVWQEFPLQCIVPVPQRAAPSEPNGAAAFVILTRKGSRIDWGAAPAQPDAPGPSPAQKVEKLRALNAEYGNLDHPTAPKEFDLRRP